jgi:hypothetical protein
VVECAEVAHAAIGYGVCPKTIYLWGRQYLAQGGFEADGRGHYDRDIWIMEEDIGCERGKTCCTCPG